ncbi:murein L,D-transpeptidase catalytic domain family protein [Chryseolinea soli]|nr:murein L,D-transpeptidase catalytic domain family protein [Chryseolinea soli]
MYFLFACLLALHTPFLTPRQPGKSVSESQAIPPDSTIHILFANEEPEAARLQFEDSLMHLYNAMDLSHYGLAFDAFRYGMIGYGTLQQQGRLSDKKMITIIDFTKPSTEKRFYTLDLSALRVVYHTYVSHGKNSGENKATSFSNIVHSNQSSMGFFATAETYVGGKGFSLKLDGLEKGYNDNARERAVVIHEAEYVSEIWIKKYGRLGRSQGCPALPKGLSKEIIQTIKNNTLIFAYYNDTAYLQSSAYLNPAPLISSLSASAPASAE